MKSWSRLIAIALLAAVSCVPASQEEKAEEIFREGQNHLLVMHPTIQNLERMQFLTNEGIFPLGEDYRIVGVYHSDASYNYSRSAEFIAEEELGNMALYRIDQPVDPDQLFSINALTPFFQDLFEQSDGVFFLGGPDIPPAVYGEEFNLLTVVTDPVRHYLESSFLFHLLGGDQDPDYTPLLVDNPDYPILGICLGMQTMNVATGGTLIQDIPTEIYNAYTVEDVIALDPDNQHRNYYSYYRLDRNVSTPSYHRIMAVPESHMGVIAGNPDLQPYVLSSHHQAIGDMGSGFIATAWSSDEQVVEAIEHIHFPHVLGIQFHPEVPYLYDPDHQIVITPGEEGQSFLEKYPGSKGEDFHRAFWVHVAGMFH